MDNTTAFYINFCSFPPPLFLILKAVNLMSQNEVNGSRHGNLSCNDMLNRGLTAVHSTFGSF